MREVEDVADRGAHDAGDGVAVTAGDEWLRDAIARHRGEDPAASDDADRRELVDQDGELREIVEYVRQERPPRDVVPADQAAADAASAALADQLVTLAHDGEVEIGADGLPTGVAPTTTEPQRAAWFSPAAPDDKDDDQ